MLENIYATLLNKSSLHVEVLIYKEFLKDLTYDKSTKLYAFNKIEMKCLIAVTYFSIHNHN